MQKYVYLCTLFTKVLVNLVKNRITNNILKIKYNYV